MKYFNDTGSFTDDYQYFGINSNQRLSLICLWMACRSSTVQSTHSG
ncbi:hypothetical protein ACEQPO_30080 [Bacillus sp. SL00103]